MACLGRLDLIAYPGSRFVQIFQAPTEVIFRDTLADCFKKAGWDVVPAVPLSGGTNSYKATSKSTPWCPDSAAPVEYIAKCKVHFYSTGDRGQTSFRVSNADETMQQSTGVFIGLLPTVNIPSIGDYSRYSYIFIGNQFDFKVFMLGVADRVTRGINQSQTAVFGGVPQIPAFLQARGKWCQYGINEMFYLVQADHMRTAETVSFGGIGWCGGVSSDIGGEHVNNQSGMFRYTYGVGRSQNIAELETVRSNYWVSDGSDNPDNWSGLLWPALIEWQTVQGDDTTTRMKGFQYDALIVNKAFPGDSLLRFDGHEFIVFTHDWHGEVTGSFKPPGAILFPISGAF